MQINEKYFGCIIFLQNIIIIIIIITELHFSVQ